MARVAASGWLTGRLLFRGVDVRTGRPVTLSGTALCQPSSQWSSSAEREHLSRPCRAHVQGSASRPGYAVITSYPPWKSVARDRASPRKSTSERTPAGAGDVRRLGSEHPRPTCAWRSPRLWGEGGWAREIRREDAMLGGETLGEERGGARKRARARAREG